MSHRRMSDFVAFPLLGFTLVTKLSYFDLKSHFFWIKIIWCQI